MKTTMRSTFIHTPYSQLFLSALFGAFLFFLWAVPGAEAESCGTITELDGAVREIEDCDNPFGVTEADYDADFMFEGKSVADGETVYIEGQETSDYTYSEGEGSRYIGARSFLHTDDGYVEVNIRPIYPGDPTHEERLALLPEYVAGDPDADLFIQTFEQDDVDLLNSQQRERYFDAVNAVYRLATAPSSPALGVGVYTFVFYEGELCVSSAPPRSLFGRFMRAIIPTAHACWAGEEDVSSVTFTVAEGVGADEEEEEPKGASSVLFLPGIQASRLYTDGLLGTENQLWEPNRTADVQKLEMTAAGESVNDIYTRDVVDKAPGIGNIYKSLLDNLEDLKADGSIKDYEAFAYDWRYDVFAVATEPVAYPDGEEKRLVEEVKRLAKDSYTGKVTIIAHSNGGLVAKALMHTYEDSELDGLIEKIVFVAVPHLGTPQAVAAMLHGDNQRIAKGFILGEFRARQLTRHMPGTYGLLPSRKYLNDYAEEMISEEVDDMALFLTSYGDLDEYGNFKSFLINNNDDRVSVSGLFLPETLLASHLNRADEIHEKLDSWVPPDDVAVYEVVGTGIPTMKGFEYREFSCKENPICALNPFVKPVPIMTSEGDGTVVRNSAAAYVGGKTSQIINLAEEGELISVREKDHKNILESPTAELFLGSVIKYPQISNTIRTNIFGNVSTYYRLIGVHSPVSIAIKNSAGDKVGLVNGEIVEEIPDASYIEFAEGKYIVVPKEEDIEILLSGEDEGSYSIAIDEFDGTEQVPVYEMVGAPVNENMKATFSCTEGSCSTIEVDYDGDGATDQSLNWNSQEVDDSEDLSEEPQQPERIGGGGAYISLSEKPEPQVAGASSSAKDLRVMWEQLQQIQKIVNKLELLINKQKNVK